MAERFSAIQLQDRSFAVIGILVKEYDDMEPSERSKAQMVRIRPGGIVSEELAKSWVKQIAEQLNRADTSILGMSGINKIT